MMISGSVVSQVHCCNPVRFLDVECVPVGGLPVDHPEILAFPFMELLPSQDHLAGANLHRDLADTGCQSEAKDLSCLVLFWSRLIVPLEGVQQRPEAAIHDFLVPPHSRGNPHRRAMRDEFAGESLLVEGPNVDDLARARRLKAIPGSVKVTLDRVDDRRHAFLTEHPADDKIRCPIHYTIAISWRDNAVELACHLVEVAMND